MLRLWPVPWNLSFLPTFNTLYYRTCTDVAACSPACLPVGLHSSAPIKPNSVTQNYDLSDYRTAEKIGTPSTIDILCLLRSAGSFIIEVARLGPFNSALYSDSLFFCSVLPSVGIPAVYSFCLGDISRNLPLGTQVKSG